MIFSSNPPVMSRVHAFTSRSILKRSVPPAERSLRSDITHYMHGPLGMFAQRNPDASWDWMLHDGLGSVRGVFDGTLQSAAEYDPFGDPDCRVQRHRLRLHRRADRRQRAGVPTRAVYLSKTCATIGVRPEASDPLRKGRHIMDTIGEMTYAELQRLIDERVKARIAEVIGRFDVSESEVVAEGEPDPHAWEQVKHDIEQDRWIPPPGAKSSLQLLREDRDH